MTLVRIMKTLVAFVLLVLFASLTLVAARRESNESTQRKPIVLAHRSTSSSLSFLPSETRWVEENSIRSEVPDVDITLKKDYDYCEDGVMCTTECEGDFSEIAAAIQDLWDREEAEYEFFFVVQGTYAIGAGVIYDNFVDRIRKLLDDSPEVHTLILFDVPGSLNDEVQLVGSQLIYENDLSTCVPSNGYVARGGTDLSISGKNRYATEGSQIGISAGTLETARTTFRNPICPTSNPGSIPFWTFFEMCEFPGTFTGTLSHGVEPIHYVTEDEIQTLYPYMRDCKYHCDDDVEDDRYEDDREAPGLTVLDDDLAAAWDDFFFSASTPVFIHSFVPATISCFVSTAALLFQR